MAAGRQDVRVQTSGRVKINSANKATFSGSYSRERTETDPEDGRPAETCKRSLDATARRLG